MISMHSSIYVYLFMYLYISAGVDIISGDRLGHLNVSRAAANKRNRMVFDLARAYNCKVPTGTA